MRKSNIIPLIITAAVFIILEIAALGMLRHNGVLQNIWISKASHTLMAKLWGGSENIKQYFSLSEVNHKLAEENFELRKELNRLYELLPEHSAKPDSLDSNKFTYIFASIEKISTNKQHNYIIVDKGSKHGVVKGSGIITNKGAVGIIDAVSDNYSYAISFQNHNMNISSRVGKEGSVGPMSWDGFSASGAILREIPSHHIVEKGDTIYTSGFSSIFPASIPLGTAEEAKIVNGATFEIKVKLFEDLNSLRYVTIVNNNHSNEIKNLENDAAE